nr:homolog of EHV2 E3 membrane protein E3 [Macronycteris gammaherpesvirus 1]
MAPLKEGLFLILGLLCDIQVVFGTCGPPTLDTLKIANGKYNSSGVYSEGHQLQLECLPGFTKTAFVLNGSSGGGRPISVSNLTITCLNNGSWSLIPKCRPKQCSNLGDITNGEIVMNESSRLYGGKVTFRCNEGYRLIGETAIYCDVTGTSVGWSNEPPTCEKVLCKPPTVSELVAIQTLKDVYEFSEAVRFECKNKSLSLIGSAISICSINSEWSPNPPKCKYVRCLHPYIQNGVFVERVYSHKYNDSLTITCNRGYINFGRNHITCNEDSSWVPNPLPKCIKATTSHSTTSRSTTSRSTTSRSTTSRSTTSRSTTKGKIEYMTQERLTSHIVNKKPKPTPITWIPSLPGAGTPIILVTLCVFIFIIIGLVAVFLNKS